MKPRQRKLSQVLEWTMCDEYALLLTQNHFAVSSVEEMNESDSVSSTGSAGNYSEAIPEPIPPL